MKIIDDTLKKPNGKWDKQALTMMLSFMLGGFTGIFIVISDYFLTKEINPYAIIVVGYFLGMASGQAVIATWNKRVDKRLDIDQKEGEEDDKFR